MQKALGAGFAYFDPRMEEGICDFGLAIWDLKQKNTGFERAVDGDSAMGVGTRGVF